MNRTLFTYLGLVVAPACALAFFAFGVADRDHDEGVRRLGDSLQAEADALARRVDSALDDASRRAQRALDDAVERLGAGLDPDFASPVAIVTGGELVGYAPPDPEPDATTDSITRRLYELSLRGGRAFEHRDGDLDRALDAYAFYVPRIQPARFRDVLRFHAARVALAGDQRETGLGLLEALHEEDSPAVTEEGLPVALLAAELLVREGALDASAAAVSIALRERVRRWAPRLDDAVLAHFAERLAPGDPELRDALAERAALAASLERAPEMLDSVDARLLLDDSATSGALLLARERSSRVGSPLRVVARARVDVPSLDAGELQATLAATPASAPREFDDPLSGTTREIRLEGDAGPLLARLEVANPGAADALAALSRRRTVHRVLVASLILLTVGAGIALLRLVFRERHLVRLRANLLANVSHELKTPVTSIRMFSELLADDPGDAERTTRFGRLLQSESLRLTRIIDNVMDFAKLGRGEMELDREPVDMASLAARLAEDFEPRAREQGVAFRCENESEDPIALTNEDAVERILVNLLENALKYRRDAEPRIDLALSSNGAGLDVTVKDNGIGVPTRERERIFEEFYRVRYEDYGVPGSGLGLAIARRLARKLGGDITLESREGEGSVFQLRLPRPPALESAASGPESEEA